MKQIDLLKKEKLAYGGELYKRRNGRIGPRPLDTKNTMHLVLRSKRARGFRSFTHFDRAIRRIVGKFANRYGVKIYSLANVGNHLHFQIKLANRYTYPAFIRAITSAIAMHITGKSRWTTEKQKTIREKFWDYRPFTRVVRSFKGLLNLRDYIRINTLEGFGYERPRARFLVRNSIWYGEWSVS